MKDFTKARSELLERIRRGLDMSDPDGCWEWRRCLTQAGYGQISVDNRRQVVHRVLYQLIHGPLNRDQYVMHTCDNPACCRIDHLRMGSQLDNMRDCNEKDRQAKGEGHGMSRLTEAQVIDIKDNWNGKTLAEVAEAFSIGQKTAHDIRTGRRWGWLYGKLTQEEITVANKGNHARGGRQGRSKFTEEIVRRIKFGDRKDVLARVIADELGVTKEAVYAIRSGKNWGHVQP